MIPQIDEIILILDELKEMNNLIITDDTLNKKDATIVDKLFDLVGEDVVEFK